MILSDNIQHLNNFSLEFNKAAGSKIFEDHCLKVPCYGQHQHTESLLHFIIIYFQITY